MVCFAVSTRLPAALLFAFLAGGAILAVFAMINSLVQLLAPEQMRGRIMSVQNTAFRGPCRWGIWPPVVGGALRGAADPRVERCGVGIIALGYLARNKAVKEL